MILDLTVYQPRSKEVFKVEILDYALHQLIEDTEQAIRVYELMSLRRPGDVWHYMWVKIVDIPEATREGCKHLRESHGNLVPPCKWPEGYVPLTAFDTLFWWDIDVTPPESACWLPVREGKRFRDFAKELFSRVKAAQAALRASEDILIQAELAAIDEHSHHRDFEVRCPFELTDQTYVSPTTPKRSKAYYEKLREVMSKPEVVCVAVRGDEDYQTLKAVLSEQRRRAICRGNRVGEDMPVSILCDGFPCGDDWGSRFVHCGEGIGYGDLFVEVQRLGSSIMDLVERHGMPRRYFLTHRDEGEIQGYIRSAGDGWVLYEHAVPTSVNYERMSAGAKREFIERWRDFHGE